MTKPDRMIDRAFDKIWQCYEVDQLQDIDVRWSKYSQTRMAILAAIQVASKCDDSIVTEWHYPPGSNEIVARLRSIGIPTAENIKYAQEAVRPVLGWEEKLEEIIRIGAGTL